MPIVELLRKHGAFEPEEVALLGKAFDEVLQTLGLVDREDPLTAMVKIKALRMLSSADPFTEPTVKDGTTYYRARFAGLDKDQAEAVCKFLKRSDVECVAIKN